MDAHTRPRSIGHWYTNRVVVIIQPHWITEMAIIDWLTKRRPSRNSLRYCRWSAVVTIYVPYVSSLPSSLHPLQTFFLLYSVMHDHILVIVFICIIYLLDYLMTLRTTNQPSRRQ